MRSLILQHSLMLVSAPAAFMVYLFFNIFFDHRSPALYLLALGGGTEQRTGVGGEPCAAFMVDNSFRIHNIILGLL